MRPAGEPCCEPVAYPDVARVVDRMYQTSNLALVAESKELFRRMFDKLDAQLKKGDFVCEATLVEGEVVARAVKRISKPTLALARRSGHFSDPV